MANTFDTGTYPQEWAAKLQERLNHPTNWKEVAKVLYTDTRIMNVPYIPVANEPVMQTGTRGTAYGFTDFTISNDALTISTFKPIATFIDQGDLAQCKFTSQMEFADLQGQKINEQIEVAMLADHASWTNIGDTGGVVTLASTGTLTVSATNIDDIIRGVRREVTKANGQNLSARNGIFMIWRPADFELLEQFVQANGFTQADIALKNGAVSGLHYMGVDHYVSNDFTAGHVFAGVKGLYTIGILKSTYGQIKVIQDPLNQSGVSVVARADYGLLTPTHYKPLLFDVNVA